MRWGGAHTSHGWGGVGHTPAMDGVGWGTHQPWMGWGGAHTSHGRGGVGHTPAMDGVGWGTHQPWVGQTPTLTMGWGTHHPMFMKHTLPHVHEAHTCQSYYGAGRAVRPKLHGWHTDQGRNPTRVVWEKSELAPITTLTHLLQVWGQGSLGSDPESGLVGWGTH